MKSEFAQVDTLRKNVQQLIECDGAVVASTILEIQATESAKHDGDPGDITRRKAKGAESRQSFGRKAE